MKCTAILQSNYIPWKGYFDLIAAVDEFILYDDMQYTRRDWRNRNQIKTPQGLQWLTVPVQVKGKFTQSIRETLINGHDWQEEHWSALKRNYSKAAYFKDVSAWLEPLYRDREYTHLSDLNRTFIEAICKQLGIKTSITNSWDYTLCEGKTERLVDLCTQAGATVYYSGPAAKDYLDEALFFKENIQVVWYDYTGYREYPQLWGAFSHEVTILDVLFNCGPKAPTYLKNLSP